MSGEVGAAHFSKLLVVEPRQNNEGLGTLYDSLNISKNSCHNWFSISKYLITQLKVVLAVVVLFFKSIFRLYVNMMKFEGVEGTGTCSQLFFIIFIANTVVLIFISISTISIFFLIHFITVYYNWIKRQRFRGGIFNPKLSLIPLYFRLKWLKLATTDSN